MVLEYAHQHLPEEMITQFSKVFIYQHHGSPPWATFLLDGDCPTYALVSSHEKLCKITIFNG
jgi:hypothetical protein